MTPARQRWATFLGAPPAPPPGKGPEWGKAAPIGLLIILLLCAAFWLLMRSMNQHIRKVRALADAEAAHAGAGTPQADAEPLGAGAEPSQTSPCEAGAPAAGTDRPDVRVDPDAAGPLGRGPRADP